VAPRGVGAALTGTFEVVLEVIPDCIKIFSLMLSRSYANNRVDAHSSRPARTGPGSGSRGAAS